MVATLGNATTAPIQTGFLQLLLVQLQQETLLQQTLLLELKDLGMFQQLLVLLSGFLCINGDSIYRGWNRSWWVYIWKEL
jgi:hypothetical protein